MAANNHQTYVYVGLAGEGAAGIAFDDGDVSLGVGGGGDVPVVRPAEPEAACLVAARDRLERERPRRGRRDGSGKGRRAGWRT